MTGVQTCALPILEKWNKKVDKFKLEKSINWNLAIIKKIDKFSITIETEYKKKLDNWNDNLDKHKLEKSINWDLAIVKKIDKFSVEIQTEKKINGIIKYENITWIKKEFNEVLKIGDIIYVENIKEKDGVVH